MTRRSTVQAIRMRTSMRIKGVDRLYERDQVYMPGKDLPGDVALDWLRRGRADEVQDQRPQTQPQEP